MAVLETKQICAVRSQHASPPATAGQVEEQSVLLAHVGAHIPGGGGGGIMAFLQTPLGSHEKPEHWTSAVQL
jgi:hypothetical protein